MVDFTSFAFIFDMDGTLVDNMHFHTESWGLMLAENGVEFNAHDFLVTTAGKTSREILPTIFTDISEERIDELTRRKDSIYHDIFLPHRKLVDGADEFLAEAKRLGIRTAVATASPIPNVEYILDGLEVRKFFDAVVTAADITNGKPHPEAFLKSAEKVGVAPENCLVFEDALGGFEAAYRAGMPSIGIATVNTIAEIMRQNSVVEAHRDFQNLSPRDLIERYLLTATAVS
jgi:beta-phosphoglucomutase family hydrolase